MVIRIIFLFLCGLAGLYLFSHGFEVQEFYFIGIAGGLLTAALGLLIERAILRVPVGVVLGATTGTIVGIVAAGVIGLIAAIIFSVALFFLLYRFVPNRRVSNLQALGAAVIAAILWEVAKQLFRWYVTSVGIYSEVYGPLGVLVALVMWIYYSAIVFVLGAEMIQTGEGRT